MSKGLGLSLMSLGVGAAALALAWADAPLLQPGPVVHVTPPQFAPDRPSPPPARRAAPSTTESGSNAAPPATISAPVRRVDLAELPRRIAVAQDTEDMKSPNGAPQLARDIQRHLKRVGCYAGDVSGEWSASTRRAMTLYLNEVNASLPVEQPQIALLALLESQTLPACGSPCGPSAQRAGDGRCRLMPAVSREIQAADGRVSTPPLDGHMSLVGPGASQKLEPDSALSSASPASEPPRANPPKRDRTPNRFGHPAWAFSNNPN